MSGIVLGCSMRIMGLCDVLAQVCVDLILV